MERYPRKIAVITGDLVNSTGLDRATITRAMAALSDLFQKEDHWIGRNFTRQSGDGWQAVHHHPEHAIRSALAMRAALRSLDAGLEAYFSISVGELESAPPQNLNEISDEVFVRSGRQLQILKDRSKKDGVLICHWDWGAAGSVAVLADHISQKWTPAQAAAILIYLNPYSDEISYTDAAEALGITRQAATKSLKSAGKDALLKALFILENALRDQTREENR